LGCGAGPQARLGATPFPPLFRHAALQLKDAPPLGDVDQLRHGVDRRDTSAALPNTPDQARLAELAKHVVGCHAVIESSGLRESRRWNDRRMKNASTAAMEY